jgi:hypothetical protein
MKSLYVLILALSLSLKCFAPNIIRYEYKIPEIANLNEVNMLISELKKAKFNNTLDSVSKSLHIKKEWLIKVIHSESTGLTTAKNKYSGASGLIGFLPSTALSLGTDTASLRKMSEVDQLFYVEKYLKGITKGRKIHSYQQLKLYIMCPKALALPDSTVLGDSTSKIYKWNKQVDIDGDGILTVKDFKSFASKK